jgi:hypothetical protein
LADEQADLATRIEEILTPGEEDGRKTAPAPDVPKVPGFGSRSGATAPGIASLPRTGTTSRAHGAPWSVVLSGGVGASVASAVLVRAGAFGPSVQDSAQQPGDETAERLNDIRILMLRAAEQLRGRQPDESLLEDQQSIADRLRGLAQEAERKAGRQPEKPTDSRTPTDSGPAGTRSGDSAEGTPAGERTDEPRERRADGADAEQGRTADADALRADWLRRAWGNLPPETLDWLIGGGGDSAVPKYQRLIEEYYRRMARPTPEHP